VLDAVRGKRLDGRPLVAAGVATKFCEALYCDLPPEPALHPLCAAMASYHELTGAVAAPELLNDQRCGRVKNVHSPFTNLRMSQLVHPLPSPVPSVARLNADGCEGLHLPVFVLL
jgi:hypothetical protein